MIGIDKKIGQAVKSIGAISRETYNECTNISPLEQVQNSSF